MPLTAENTPHIVDSGFFRSRLQAVRNNPFLANTVKLAGGSALGQALVVATTPVITRLYSPSRMGLFGVFVAFLTFATVGATLRYDLAIVTAKDKREADVLLIACVFLSVLYVTLASALLYGMIALDILHYAVLPRWSALAMLVILFATGIFSALRFWYVGRSRFNEISIAQVYQGAGRASIPLAYAMFSSDWVGLLAGEFAGRVFGGTRLIRGAWPDVRETLSSLSRSEVVQVLRKYWKYPAVFLPSSIVDALSSSLPLPVISLLFGLEAAGQYFLVYRLASVPASLVSAGVADVLHAKLTDVARTDRVSVHRLMGWTLRRLLALGSLVYIPAAVVSPFIFSIMFGASWKQAGILMAIQSLASVSSVVSSPLSRAFVVSKHPEYKFLSDVCRIALPLSGLIAAHHFHFGFLICMAIFCALSSAAEVLYLAVIWYSTTEERQISFGDESS